MQRTIIHATIDLLEEYLQSIDETALNTDDTSLLKNVILYWKHEAIQDDATRIISKTYNETLLNEK